MKQKKKTKVRVGIEKLRFLMGILIVVTGGALMMYLLEVTVDRYVVGMEDYIIFPISIILLITGIGVIARNVSSFK